MTSLCNGHLRSPRCVSFWLLLSAENGSDPAGIAGLAAGFAAYAGVILVDALAPRGGQADLAVVFGSKVLADGAPSARLKARLDAAKRLARYIRRFSRSAIFI
jgi:hypothetical protein